MNEKELIELLQKEFRDAFDNDDTILRLYGKIQQGKATHKDSAAFAVRAGEILSKVLTSNLSQDMFPSGNMDRELAEHILMPLFRSDYGRVVEAAAEVQKDLNQKAGIGLKPIVPKFDVDRAQGLVEKVSSYQEFKDAVWTLKEPVVTQMQHYVDETVRKNADFHARVGFSPKIVRTAESGACKWCRGLVGTYDYADVSNTGNDVFRRHERCRCVVEYDPGDGTRQDVWTKKVYRKSDAENRVKASEDLQHRRESEQRYRLIERTRRADASSTQQGNYSRSFLNQAKLNLKQYSEKVSIPEQLKNDFLDFEPLDISEHKKEQYLILNNLSKENGFEYAQLLFDSKDSEIYTSYDPNTVGVNLSILGESDRVSIIHSHTNVTPLSSKDFEFLLNEKVDSIGNITINGDVFEASVGYGYIPTLDEYNEAVDRIRHEVIEDLIYRDDFVEMSPSERNYVTIREETYRIAREFGWSLKGGRIDE